MPTSISNLWIPNIWIRGVNEKVALLPALISSPVVLRNEIFDNLASGGGTSVNIPYFRDITQQSDAPQVENTQPTIQVIGSGQQVAPILNREYAVSATALAAQVSQVPGSAPLQPIEVMTAQLALGRQMRRQATMVNILKGIFGFANAPAGAGAMSAVRNDIFLEAGAAPPAGQCVSVNAIVDTIALLGELAASTLGGGIMMHSVIRAALLKADQISFEHYSLQNGTVLVGGAPVTNQGGYIEMYKGYRVFVSDSLVRAGTTSGKVYATYVFMPGVFAWGEKAQAAQSIDAASLSYWLDVQKNNEELYDRTRFIIHPNGLKWTGTPAGQSAADSELATAGNWSLDYSTANRVGIACLRSNG